MKYQHCSVSTELPAKLLWPVLGTDFREFGSECHRVLHLFQESASGQILH